MAWTEVCIRCGAVIGARAFWTWVDPKSRAYFSRCPLCGQEDPWRKATREDVEAFRERATGRRPWRPNALTIVVLLLLVLFLAPTCT